MPFVAPPGAISGAGFGPFFASFLGQLWCRLWHTFGATSAPIMDPVPDALLIQRGSCHVSLFPEQISEKEGASLKNVAIRGSGRGNPDRAASEVGGARDWGWAKSGTGNGPNLAPEMGQGQTRNGSEFWLRT